MGFVPSHHNPSATTMAASERNINARKRCVLFLEERMNGKVHPSLKKFILKHGHSAFGDYGEEYICEHLFGGRIIPGEDSYDGVCRERNPLESKIRTLEEYFDEKGKLVRRVQLKKDHTKNKIGVFVLAVYDDVFDDFTVFYLPDLKPGDSWSITRNSETGHWGDPNLEPPIIEQIQLPL